MQNKTLTLRELADKLNVSKSYIDKTIRTLGMHNELKKNGNKYIVNTSQQKKIEQFLNKKKANTETNTKSNTSMHTSERSEIIFLRSQLVERNKEIENLYRILDQQQQLQLKTQNLLEEQKLISSSDKELENELNPTNRDIAQLTSELAQQKKENEQLQNELSALKSAPKKGFWQRLFHS